MARYGQKFKERVVARLLPPESSPVEAVSPAVGISAGTLERWRAEILAKPSGDEARHWTPAARLEAVIATAAMNQAAQSAWCREHGVHLTELETWKQTWKQDAIGGLGEPRETESVALKRERRRNKELERELHRKDKALAETAALLVLSKIGGDLPRPRGRMTRPEDRLALIDLITEARAGGSRQAPACIVAGVDPRTVQRWRKNDGLTRGDRRPDAVRPAPSHARTEEERAHIVAVANQPRFAETPPARIVPALADEGVCIAVNPASIACRARMGR